MTLENEKRFLLLLSSLFARGYMFSKTEYVETLVFL